MVDREGQEGTGQVLFIPLALRGYLLLTSKIRKLSFIKFFIEPFRKGLFVRKINTMIVIEKL